MGRPKIDRTGEETYNKFGSKMIITNYRNYEDIDIYFPKYNWTFEHTRYDNFKSGNIKCPYEPRVHSHGYVGEGKYKASENGKITKYYSYWNSMLQRCYDNKFKEKRPTYEGCEVCAEWHNFQAFAEWYNDNYYEIPGEVMSLDKDILFKGNKIYSPETCVFVSNEINLLFTKSNKSRGDYPIGVSYHKRDKMYMVRCNNGKGSDYLGRFDNIYDAFYMYKVHKEKIIKQRADEYKQYLPQNVYEALYNYQVEITD